MQPLAYLGVRGLLAWIQFLERQHRAFGMTSRVLVALGAAHCWAVVYSLFIAIHTRAMRFNDYHQGYTAHLPWWVSFTERLAIGSMGVWWLAGFSTASIRILDEDADGLPMEIAEADGDCLTQILRSRKLRLVLGVAQTVSCVGLFLSILLLCSAMLLMQGALTVCEFCLLFISAVFAVPHVAVAARHVGGVDERKKNDVAVPDSAADAAAQEAAAICPQLCVLLALADSPAHAYSWQKAVYLLASFATAASIASCGRAPPKVKGAALPPEVLETLACLIIDAAAGACLIICYPHLNTWHLWALMSLLAVLFVIIAVKAWRDFVLEIFGPLLEVRSGEDKRLPSFQRSLVQRVAWGCCLACSASALWDIASHPIEEPAAAALKSESATVESTEPYAWDYDDSEDDFPDYAAVYDGADYSGDMYSGADFEDALDESDWDQDLVPYVDEWDDRGDLSDGE